MAEDGKTVPRAGTDPASKRDALPAASLCGRPTPVNLILSPEFYAPSIESERVRQALTTGIAVPYRGVSGSKNGEVMDCMPTCPALAHFAYKIYNLI
ncbi:hypothetical protein [Bordetella sp. FB-8]|uniref:hypothetical protein n=1 Tax=Bordetella sp. FB-8 TaxID=1159870 RepID=UPI0003646A6F|nr:hypothetical protein [Bordetella sp. FB-8]